MWAKIRVWFKDSETIVWARLQMLIGGLWTVLSVTDLTPIFSLFGWEKYIPASIFVMGLITEMVRRHREPHDLGIKTVADLDTVMLPIKKDDIVAVDHSTGTVSVTKTTEAIPAAVMALPAGDKIT